MDINKLLENEDDRTKTITLPYKNKCHFIEIRKWLYANMPFSILSVSVNIVEHNIMITTNNKESAMEIFLHYA